jgi:hypothetical protein
MKLAAQTRRNIIRMARSRFVVRDIARMAKVSRPIVRELLQREGIAEYKSPRERRRKEKFAAERLLQEGHSPAAIAASFGEV